MYIRTYVRTYIHTYARLSEERFRCNLANARRDERGHAGPPPELVPVHFIRNELFINARINHKDIQPLDISSSCSRA